MSLYPSLRDIGEGIGEREGEGTNKHVQNESEQSAKISTNEVLYPSIQNYIGLNLSDHENTTKANEKNFMADQKTRLVILKKYSRKPKFGLVVSAINNGIYICFVLRNSPAARAGLRFGEQILSIGDQPVDGFTAEKVHDMLKEIKDHETIAVKIGQRPFETRVSVIKDGTGSVGIEIHDGKIHSVTEDSPAAYSGLLKDHRILEINGQTVLGLTHKEIVDLIRKGGKIINFATMPIDIFEKMMEPLSPSYVRRKIDQSIHFDDASYCF